MLTFKIANVMHKIYAFAYINKRVHIYPYKKISEDMYKGMKKCSQHLHFLSHVDGTNSSR